MVGSVVYLSNLIWSEMLGPWPDFWGIRISIHLPLALENPCPIIPPNYVSERVFLLRMDSYPKTMSYGIYQNTYRLRFFCNLASLSLQSSRDVADSDSQPRKLCRSDNNDERHCFVCVRETMSYFFCYQAILVARHTDLEVRRSKFLMWFLMYNFFSML